MTPEEFVSDLKRNVHDPAIDGVVAQLAEPSGRRPGQKLRELSSWFNALPEQQRENVRSAVGLGVHAALFGVLCAIDGVTKVTDATLELRLRSAGEVLLLNADSDECLHDLYQAKVYEQLFGPVV